MYRLVIVDDESYIRTMLTDLPSWSHWGYEVVGNFSSFQNALSFLQNNPVDVLFTDIRLGSHSGLDLIREAKRLSPGMQSVIISAFGEFSYAQTAISLSVFEYLLKPINMEKIESCFVRLAEQLPPPAELGAASSGDEKEEYKDTYVQMAKQYMQSHLLEKITLEQVAQHLSLSSSYFSRCFHESTGERFIDVLSHMKIAHACKLLADPSIRISEIAQLIGYDSSKWFSSIFQKEMGVTPKAYRQNLFRQNPEQSQNP